VTPFPKDKTSSKDRIIEAAYRCFHRFGIRKTTIDDIASAARVARPTFYNYFTSKSDVVDYLRQLELLRVNQEIRARMKKYSSFAEALTEAILLSVTVAKGNDYIRALIEDPLTVSEASVPNSQAQRVHLERWGPLLNRARERGELREGLLIEQVVSWLTLVQQLLLTKLEANPLPESELRSFIRTFIVTPVLNPEAAASDQP
jgi:AcrR family transcriptional regulator